MKIVQYGMEINAERHPVMVREAEHEVSSVTVNNPEEAMYIFRHCFRAEKQAEEHIYLITLDVRKRITGLFDVAHGQADSCAVSAREIYMRALTAGAVSIIVAHNHPSGNPAPSCPDNDFSLQMKTAGDLLNIKLEDSIIIGDGTYYSFKSAGLL